MPYIFCIIKCFCRHLASLLKRKTVKSKAKEILVEVIFILFIIVMIARMMGFHFRPARRIHAIYRRFRGQPEPKYQLCDDICTCLECRGIQNSFKLYFTRLFGKRLVCKCKGGSGIPKNVLKKEGGEYGEIVINEPRIMDKKHRKKVDTHSTKTAQPPKTVQPAKISHSPKLVQPPKIDQPPKLDHPSKLDHAPKLDHPSKLNHPSKLDHAPKLDHAAARSPIGIQNPNRIEIQSDEQLHSKCKEEDTKTNLVKTQIYIPENLLFCRGCTKKVEEIPIVPSESCESLPGISELFSDCDAENILSELVYRVCYKFLEKVKQAQMKKEIDKFLAEEHDK